MSRMDLRERIKQGPFLLDGAMGTQLIARGVEVGKCNDYLNIESPEVVAEVHRSYFEAGSDAVLTNTFGANKCVLARHDLDDNVEQINKAGAEVAREAAGEDNYVLADIGPSGGFLQPIGTLTPEELKEAFAEQVQGLLAGGVDGFIVETMTALAEAAIAIKAAKAACELPVFASMAFNPARDGFRTMMGIDVDAAVTKIVSLGVDALGFNCGTNSLDEYVELTQGFVSTVKAANKDVLILAEPNAGKPELLEGKTVYNVGPEDFAAAVEKIHAAGATIIGGCCGTAPAHIEAVAKLVKV
ncbi:MAG: homocysteine S-methyltransferase family protein [Planctomycetota bacterium]